MKEYIEAIVSWKGGLVERDFLTKEELESERKNPNILNIELVKEG